MINNNKQIIYVQQREVPDNHGPHAAVMIYPVPSVVVSDVVAVRPQFWGFGLWPLAEVMPDRGKPVYDAGQFLLTFAVSCIALKPGVEYPRYPENRKEIQSVTS